MSWYAAHESTRALRYLMVLGGMRADLSCGLRAQSEWLGRSGRLVWLLWWHRQQKNWSWSPKLIHNTIRVFVAPPRDPRGASLHALKRVRDPFRPLQAVPMAAFTQSRARSDVRLVEAAPPAAHRPQPPLFPPSNGRKPTDRCRIFGRQPAPHTRLPGACPLKPWPQAAQHGCCGGLCHHSRPLGGRPCPTVVAKWREAQRPSRPSRRSSKAVLCTPPKLMHDGSATSAPVSGIIGGLWAVWDLVSVN